MFTSEAADKVNESRYKQCGVIPHFKICWNNIEKK